MIGGRCAMMLKIIAWQLSFVIWVAFSSFLLHVLVEDS